MKQQSLLKNIRSFTGESIQFVAAESYYWSPVDATVYYQKDDMTEVGTWTLLHEACHAILEHKTYESDFELLLLEVAAWEKAEALAKELKIEIDHNHVQDCLDSYRDWQYKRSLCPSCDLGGIQLNQKTYQCFFCDSTWTVTAERFFRPYRRKNK